MWRPDRFLRGRDGGEGRRFPRVAGGKPSLRSSHPLSLSSPLLPLPFLPLHFPPSNPPATTFLVGHWCFFRPTRLHFTTWSRAFRSKLIELFDTSSSSPFVNIFIFFSTALGTSRSDTSTLFFFSHLVRPQHSAPSPTAPDIATSSTSRQTLALLPNIASHCTKTSRPPQQLRMGFTVA